MQTQDLGLGKSPWKELLTILHFPGSSTINRRIVDVWGSYLTQFSKLKHGDRYSPSESRRESLWHVQQFAFNPNQWLNPSVLIPSLYYSEVGILSLVWTTHNNTEQNIPQHMNLCWCLVLIHQAKGIMAEMLFTPHSPVVPMGQVTQYKEFL